MSRIQNQLLCSPNKFPNTNYAKTKLSFFGNSNKKYITQNNNLKIAVSRDKMNSFGIPCRILRHPLESELPLMEDEYGNNHSGVGIVEFFQGKNIFITGASGLVGKVLVEKMLRSTPVEKIYVLIKAKNEEAALDRLTKEIINSELFKCLQEQHGKSYASFVRDKLIPIVGDITKPNLGMDNESANAIMKNVDVIIQSAASTTLNDRYDFLIDLNANAPQRLMRFAKSCKNLKLFAHISTAYVNGRREGMILEKPLTMGENVRSKENDLNENGSCSFLRLDLGDELWLSRRSSMSSDQDLIIDDTKYLKKLGQERAEFYGWYNAYHMTKAMGEMIIHEMKGDVPVLIIRPSVIESCYQGPLPGWIQGNRMYDPVILSFGKGQLPAYLADPQVSMDIIPVDMVANTTVAAMAKHGRLEKQGLDVYHVASATRNPLRFCEFFDIIHEYFASNPLPNSKCESDIMIKKMKCFDHFDDFSEHTRHGIWERYRSTNGAVGTDEKLVQKLCKPKVAYAEQLCKMYEFVGFIKGRFHTGNTQRLLQEMSEEEQLSFEIDVTKIDWRKYFQEIHIPGLRKYVLNNRENVRAL